MADSLCHRSFFSWKENSPLVWVASASLGDLAEMYSTHADAGRDGRTGLARENSQGANGVREKVNLPVKLTILVDALLHVAA